MIGRSKQTGTRSQVARDLKTQVSKLRRWQIELEQRQDKSFPGKGKLDDEELVRLQRVKQQVEILEKATRMLDLPIKSCI